MPELSPYVLERSSGLLHVRLRGDGRCIGDCRLDVAEILMQEARRELLAEVRAAAERAAVKERAWPAQQWKVSGDKMADLTADIYPFLTVKRRQAIVAWNLQRLKDGVVTKRGQPIPAENMAKRRALYDVLHDLNQRRDAIIPSWCSEPRIETEPGWYLRSDCIWSKPNPMPESVTDRPTKAHEYVFLLSKSARYFFDQDAVREAFTDSTIQRIKQESIDSQEGGWKQEQYKMGFPGKKHRDRKPAEIIRAMARSHRDRSNFRNGTDDPKLAHKGFEDVYPNEGGRNIRTVWTIATQPSPLPHFAAFPDELAERCIKAGCPQDGTVLDPFAGTGTTLKVARDLGRKAIGIELSPEYVELATQRLTYGVKGVLAIQQGQGTL